MDSSKSKKKKKKKKVLVTYRGGNGLLLLLLLWHRSNNSFHGLLCQSKAFWTSLACLLAPGCSSEEISSATISLV
jgi:hypothetical protein